MDAEKIDFGFVLPHWFYWGWLALMPIAMIAVCYYLESCWIFTPTSKLMGKSR